MTDTKTTDLLDTPVTPGALLDATIAKTDLPKRQGASWSEYLARFEDAELVRRLEGAIQAAVLTDVDALKHWVRQAEDWFLRLLPQGKNPNRS